MSAREAGEFAGTDRFVVQGRLGAGGYGVVYRALDLQRNIPVALKTLRQLAPKALVRFKQEFRALADVSHPNLATLYELSSHEDQWFFTMELVDGVNFLCYVRGESSPSESGSTSAVSGPTSSNLRAFFDEPQRTASAVGAPPAGVLSLDRLRHALPQLAEGVIALHEAGKMHRDIKPSNVLVTREGRVVLLDFGLVAEIAPAQSDSQDAVGTPAYMSPEQMAGRTLTRASDWYNVGSMLYQALTGQIPFAGTLLDVIRRKQESEPPPPAEISPGVPRDLGALCQGLLRRDPDQRPSGMEVLQALREARATVAAASPPAAVVAGSAPFVGRVGQLAELRDAFARLKEGRALTVAVHGGSGMGKSALVRRFLEELRTEDPEVVVLAGRCYERESVPYKALDALIDALSRYLRRLPSAQAEAFLPHDILALARVFPVVRQVKAVSRARRAVLEIPDSIELRRRAFAALRELLVRLADRRALVLFIDDLQWGDADSAALLEALLRPPDPPVLLLIGCYRSEEAQTSPLLRTILPKRLAVDPSLEMRDIVLGELSASEAAELARALVGGTPEEREARAETIARESGGNPFFIEELVRFSSAGTKPVAADVTFDHVIETRVSRLPELARRLLDVVAVSGVPIEVGVAYRAADLEKEGESVLATLRVAHLVRTRSTLSRHEIETYHDRIRDAVVAHLSPDLLRECHHRLASALLATGRADPETLATHYLGVGDTETAAEYAAVAAAKASEALAFDRAASLYRFALNLVSATPERAKLQVQLGDALASAGQGVDAATAYLSAAKDVGPALGIEVQRRAAQQLYMSGHIEAGEQALEGVLAKLGMKLPKTPRVALLSLLVRRVQVRLRGLRFHERDETQISAQDLLRIDTCWAVGVGLGIVDMVRGADFQARHLVLALRAGEPYRVARALAMEGAYVSMGGSRNRKRSQRLLQAAHALAERVRQPYAIGLATLTSGNAAMLDGRWRDGRRLCEQAEQTLRDRSAGVDWEILIAQLCGLACMFFLGELAALSQRQRALREEAEGRGSRLRAAFLRTGFCSHIAWLAADDVVRAREELDTGLSGWRQSERFDYLRLWVRGARTDIALYAGEPVASEGVGKELRASARALERFVQMGFIRGIDSRARRRLAMAAQATGGSERTDLLRGVEAHADAIVKEKTHWGHPLASLLRAGAAATRGEPERTLPLLESAEAGLAAADMALHAVVCRRRRGELLGGDAGRGLVAAADAWMAGQGIRRPERMTAMLAPGRWQ